MNLKKKKLYSFFTILLLLFGSSNLVFATPNSNTNIINESLEKYNSLDNETLKINSEIADLNQRIEELNLNLTKKENEISATEIQIENTTNKIKDTEDEIAKKEDLMENRIRNMYKTDLTTSFISYIISSKNIFELLSRANSIKQIISADRNIILEINEKKTSLLQDKELIENKKAELITLKTSIENDLSEVNSKKIEQEKLLVELDKKKVELMQTIETNELSLISNSINIINSNSNSIDELNNALNNLSSLLPQLNTNSAIEATNSAIEKANNQIAILKEKLQTSTAIEVEKEPSIESSNSIENSKATYSMVATAYTGGSLTAMGLKPIRDPNGISTIAVDPSVIPLGSKVYVEGYGLAIASDTGGAIKGNKIDIYMNSLSDCIAFGNRTVTVSVLAYPNEW